MQKFYCDWCEADVLLTTLDTWTLALKHRGAGAGQVEVEICPACSILIGLRTQSDGQTRRALVVACLHKMLDLLRERAKSSQGADVSKENRQ